LDPTDLLMAEHQLIKGVLRCLEQLAHRCSTDGKLREQPAREAIGFFRDYVERFHHAKEDRALFPLMEDKGLSEEQSLTGDLIADHELGRFHLTAMEEALPGAAAAEPSAVDRFVRHANDYACMLFRHMRREDDFLFPLADVALSTEECAALKASFEEIDTGENVRPEELESEAEKLIERCGVEMARVLHSVD
jgi:hemerythrin-like domain-containing protein